MSTYLDFYGTEDAQVARDYDDTWYPELEPHDGYDEYPENRGQFDCD